MAAIDTLTERQVNEVLAALRGAARRVEDVLDGTGARGGEDPTEYERFVALQRKAAIEREILELERRLAVLAGRGITAGSMLAAEASEAEALAVGSKVVLGINPNVIAYVQATAADQVVGLTDDLKASLRRTITKAVAGGFVRDEFRSEVRRILGAEATEARVERIVRTEMSRAYEQQKAANDVRLVELGVDLVKVWRHLSRGPQPREDHLAIDGQERELDEMFNVGGGATAGTEPGSGVGEEAWAPLDPALSAEQSIHCGCTVIRIPRAQARQPYTSKTAPALV